MYVCLAKNNYVKYLKAPGSRKITIAIIQQQ